MIYILTIFYLCRKCTGSGFQAGKTVFSSIDPDEEEEVRFKIISEKKACR